MPLNAKQRGQLLVPINPRRVQHTRGQSHVAGYDVSAHLTRIFGFGNWEKHIRSLDLVCEDSVKDGNRTGWWVTYKCEMTLVVKDPAGDVIWSGDDAATGTASNLPSRGDAHDFAVKNAVTYALKRCAKDWGDQFGLSLYNKGSMAALVGTTLDLADDAGEDVQQDLPELHPDSDDTPEPGGDATPVVREPEPARPARQESATAGVPREPRESDEATLLTWRAKIDEITSVEDANAVDAELKKMFGEKKIDAATGNAVRSEIRAKVASLPGRQMAGAR